MSPNSREPYAEHEPSAANHELPPDLRALELRLASLVPRSDVLDHDALMFRAGQLSVLAARGIDGLSQNGRGDLRSDVSAGSETRAERRLTRAERLSTRAERRAESGNRPTWRSSWFWPAGCAAMTAVAASLLVVLAARPQPSVIERDRIVRVTDPPAPDQHASPEGSPSKAPASDIRPEMPRKHTAELADRDGHLMGYLLGWLEGDSSKPGPIAAIAARNEILAKGPEAWKELSGGTESKKLPQGPSDRRQWLVDLLGDQT